MVIEHPVKYTAWVSGLSFVIGHFFNVPGIPIL